MTIHVLVEGPSELALLDLWVQRLLKGHPFRIHRHQGKGTLPQDPERSPDPKRRGLLDQLPAKLRGFANSTEPSSHEVVVLVDADDEDHVKLAQSIRGLANQVAPHISVSVCIAVEETEAFYLGDLKGLKKAFPDADLQKARDYEPDSICGTWELFGEIVGDGGGNKVAWAEAMGPVLTIKAKESRSPSFKNLVAELISRKPKPKPKKSPRKYRHRARSRSEASGRR